MPYLLLADFVLLIHIGVVLFVVGGLPLIVAGNWRGWDWVNRWGFRTTHLGAILWITLQTWLGQLCPLTELESWLRANAGQPPYSTTFLQHWADRLLYFEAPLWVFAVLYTAFTALVAAVWWRFPPRGTHRIRQDT